MAGSGSRRKRGRPPRLVDEALLAEAAIGAFAREGYSGATLESIALEAGIERTLIYRRFGSKQEIHRWAVEREAQNLMDRLLAAYDLGADTTPAGALRSGFGALIDYSTERPDGFRLLFEPDRSGGDAATATERIRAAVLERVEQLVATHTPPALTGTLDAAVVAAMIVGAAEGVARDCGPRAKRDPAAVVELLTTTFEAGLAALAVRGAASRSR